MLVDKTILFCLFVCFVFFLQSFHERNSLVYIGGDAIVLVNLDYELLLRLRGKLLAVHVSQHGCDGVRFQPVVRNVDKVIHWINHYPVE